VDQFSNELFTTKDSASVEGEQSMYTVYAEEPDAASTLVYCFGKAVGSDLGTVAAQFLHRKSTRIVV